MVISNHIRWVSGPNEPRKVGSLALSVDSDTLHKLLGSLLQQADGSLLDNHLAHLKLGPSC